MCKGANDAVMAEMNYDGLTLIFIDCRPSLLDSGHFFLWSGLVAAGCSVVLKSPSQILNSNVLLRLTAMAGKAG